MNHDPSSPPSSRRQPESSDPAPAGHEWNNRITRRSFLKRTGGATLATMVTWHGMNQSVRAGEPPRAKIVTKIKITVPAGQTLPFPLNPENDAPKEWVEILESSSMDSGDTLSAWNFNFIGGGLILEEEIVGEAVIICTRVVQKN